MQETTCMIPNTDNIVCWDAVGSSSFTTVPSEEICTPPAGKVLLIEVHTEKTSANRRRASKTQETDKTRKDFFNPIFFRRSTDNRTPKLFQYNCAAYMPQT